MGARGFRRERHVDAIVTDLGAITDRGVREARWWLAVARRVVVAVPGAAEPTMLDGALSQRTTLVRAPVLEGAVAAWGVSEGERPPVDGHGLDPINGQFVRVERLVPLVAVGGQLRWLQRRQGNLRLGGHQRYSG